MSDADLGIFWQVLSIKQNVVDFRLNKNEADMKLRQTEVDLIMIQNEAERQIEPEIDPLPSVR